MVIRDNPIERGNTRTRTDNQEEWSTMNRPIETLNSRHSVSVGYQTTLGGQNSASSAYPGHVSRGCQRENTFHQCRSQSDRCLNHQNGALSRNPWLRERGPSRMASSRMLNANSISCPRRGLQQKQQHDHDDANTNLFSTKRESYSIIEALERFEEQYDDLHPDNLHPGNHCKPCPDGARHSKLVNYLQQQRTGSRHSTSERQTTIVDDKNKVKEGNISWDMATARRPPTTNFGGGMTLSAARKSEQAAQDGLLALALQQEEDEYAASLLADRDRREEEERQQLGVNLLEQGTGPHTCEHQEKVIAYNAPDKRNVDDEEADFTLVVDRSCLSERCSICLDSLSEGLVVVVRHCNHLFHLDCLDDALTQSNRCPHCRQDIRTPRTGTSPSGTMTITRPELAWTRERLNQSSLGRRVIQIEYMILDGIQKEYHDSPGQPFKGTIKVAYLPNSCPGRRLLKRLIFAFQHGMTFRITRRTDSEQGVVRWASIPHPLSPGDTEVEDTVYAASCDAALDQLGVPTLIAAS